ncbi:hypothetical protein CSW64_14840 [Caulobacter mirabilis]|uniref:Uncharacterized protein n=1 Tax=Caulobacter mirabilis TaxID=69666 RepID=A0A2D2B014_9CAUL|nr:hypothetical protein CSW64_14840 [Caulobacter mirabilis]
MDCLKIALQLVAAGCGLVSGYCWIRAATDRVIYRVDADGRGLDGAAVTWTGRDGVKINLSETLTVQGRWNSRAAYLAAASAVAIAVQMLINLA